MTHVKATQTDSESWCGVVLGPEFHLKDAEFAAINGKTNGHLKICELCAEKIIKCLIVGVLGHENEEKKPDH